MPSASSSRATAICRRGSRRFYSNLLHIPFIPAFSLPSVECYETFQQPRLSRDSSLFGRRYPLIDEELDWTSFYQRKYIRVCLSVCQSASIVKRQSTPRLNQSTHWLCLLSVVALGLIHQQRFIVSLFSPIISMPTGQRIKTCPTVRTTLTFYSNCSRPMS